MVHSEYIREVPGGRGAVLMIHGILGTPRHFDFLLPLIPEDWAVCNILLDGHGGKVEDFSHSSMEKWKTQVSERLDDLLARYDRVLLVAHSMGTLFCIQEAIRRPKKIAELFLLQTPLRPRMKLSSAIHAALMPFGIVVKAAEDMYRGTSVGMDIRLWKYLGWIPRFLELFAECAATRKLLGQITVPCRIYQSAKDEMVSMGTCKDLAAHPQLQVTVLQHSGHYAYKDPDQTILMQDFAMCFLR